MASIPACFLAVLIKMYCLLFSPGLSSGLGTGSPARHARSYGVKGEQGIALKVCMSAEKHKSFA